MTSVIANGKQKWQQLNAREQMLVSIMSAFIVVFLFYSLVWQPLNTNIAKAAKQLQRRQALLTWVQDKTQQYSHVSRSGKRINGSLTSIVNRTSRQKQISVTRMQPQNADLQVWVNEVPFDTLFVWLIQLVEKEGLAIKALDISTADEQGVVRVRRLQLGKH